MKKIILSFMFCGYCLAQGTLLAKTVVEKSFPEKLVTANKNGLAGNDLLDTKPIKGNNITLQELLNKIADYIRSPTNWIKHPEPG